MSAFSRLDRGIRKADDLRMTEVVKIERQTLSRDGFRFELRPYFSGVEEEALEAVIESREEVAPWMDWLHADYSMADCLGWVEGSIKRWDAGESYEFVVFDREDGRVVGSCGLNSICRQDLFCNLGYWVRSSKCRLGAATQAVRLIWEFGAEVVALNRMEIVVADGNDASRRVAEKSGAIYEGMLRDRLRVGEKVFDAHMHACLRTDFCVPSR